MEYLKKIAVVGQERKYTRQPLEFDREDDYNDDGLQRTRIRLEGCFKCNTRVAHGFTLVSHENVELRHLR